MSRKTLYDYETMNDIRIAGLMTDDDEQLFYLAREANDEKKLKELFKKYIGAYQKTEEVEVTIDAITLYNQFRKTLKVQLMKEEVLEECDHTCFMCKHQYPTKDEFKKKHKRKTYPLFIRCGFSVPRYIEVNKFLDVQECLADPVLRDKRHYLPICLDCKPSRFAK